MPLPPPPPEVVSEDGIILGRIAGIIIAMILWSILLLLFFVHNFNIPSRDYMAVMSIGAAIPLLLSIPSLAPLNPVTTTSSAKWPNKSSLSGVLDLSSDANSSATTVRTFNSLGHKIWAAAVDRKLSLNQKKIFEIFRAIADETPRGERSYLWTMYDSVLAATSIARNIGYIPPEHFKAPKSLCDFSAVERLLDETLLPSPSASPSSPPRRRPINKFHLQPTFFLTSPTQSSIIRDNQRNNRWES